jgi:hypothetical protein
MNEAIYLTIEILLSVKTTFFQTKISNYSGML